MTLHQGHNWGDDFAQYILHAINLAEHKPYTQDIVLDLWTVVPPGYPLFLSSVIYWVGVNFKVLKFLNILFWGITALVAYFLARPRLGMPVASLLTIWFLSAPYFFWFKQNVLSDIPFLGMVFMSIWTFSLWQTQEKSGHKQIAYWLTIILMVDAMLIRWAGIGLFLAAILYIFVHKMNWRGSLGFIIGALIAAVVGKSFGASASGHFGQHQFDLSGWFYAVWMNIAYLPKAFMDFTLAESLSQPIGSTVFLISKLLGPIVFIGITWSFVQRLKEKRISFLGCFAYLYLLGMILWPVQQGLSRYILPLIIPGMIYGLAGLQEIGQKKILVVVLVVLIGHNVMNIGQKWTFNDDDLYRKDVLEMANWVVDNLKPEEHFMFYKPRALRLLTNRTGASFWVYPADQKYWHFKVQRLNIQYVIADKKLDELAHYDNLNLPVQNSTLRLNKIWENNQYKIFSCTYSMITSGNSMPGAT